MGLALWFVWFWFSRKFTYLFVSGLWAFSGIICLAGSPGRPHPPEAYGVLWLLGTLALIPLMLWYTKYNISVFLRMTARVTRQTLSCAAREWDNA